MFLLVPVTHKELENQVSSLPIKPVKAGQLLACIAFHESRVVEK